MRGIMGRTIILIAFLSILGLWPLVGMAGATSYSMTIPCNQTARDRQAAARQFTGAIFGPFVGVPWYFVSEMRKNAGYKVYMCDKNNNTTE